MKRDWDCIRAVLAALDDKGDAASKIRPKDIREFDPELVSYQIHLLLDAKLVNGSCDKLRLDCFAQSMTWEGHELLDKMLSDGLWNKIKSTAREQGIKLSFEAVKALGKHALDNLLTQVS